MPGHEYCNALTDDVEPGLLLLQSLLEALELQITGANLHPEMLMWLIPSSDSEAALILDSKFLSLVWFGFGVVWFI